MSMDLYERDISERMTGFRPISAPEPGVFDNFAYSAGTAAMRTFATAGRSALTLAGGVASLIERAGELHPLGKFDRTVSDAIFKAADDIGQRAVDYWTPNPNEVGVAGQVVGQLAATIPMVIASPGAMVAATQMGTAEDLARKGVDTTKAVAAGTAVGAGLGLGIWVPILGRNLWERVVLGGVGFNVLQGAATRGAAGAIVEGTPGEGDFKTLDPVEITLDVLLGAAFGGIAHLSPALRAQGADFMNQFTRWGEGLKPSDVDALATLRQAQHLNVDSMPGKPVDATDIEAHVQRMRTAIDQLANDRPVQVDDLPAARVTPDDARMAANEAQAKELVGIAEQVREAEGLPPVPETEARPAEPAEPPRSMAERDGATVREGETPDPLTYAAEKVIADQPDLTLSMGRDADGNPVTMTAREYLDSVRADVAAAMDDVRLFEAAAVCLLGKS